MNLMKKIIGKHIIQYVFGITIVVFSLNSCGSSKTENQKKNTQYSTLKFEKESTDSTEYEIIITDIGYESFLITQKPINFYSQKYYENWNSYYVSDWNQKVQTSMYHSAKYQNVFDMYIDYNQSINYGIEVNYKLYYYFMFVEKRYGIRFRVPRAINY